MKYTIILLGTLLAFLVVVIGCSDDDCPTCPNRSQTATAVGTLSLSDDGYIGAYGQVVGVNGQIPIVDSIRIDTMKADFETGVTGTNVKEFEYHSGVTTYVGGDTVSVSFHTPSGVSTARVKLLVYPDDAVVIDSGFRAYDSAETAEFFWESSPNADWYFLETNFQYYNVDDELVNSLHRLVKGVDDTTLTIPGDSLAYNGRLTIWLVAGTGADPMSAAGNITGGYVGGNIMSGVFIGHHMPVGSGLPTKSPETLSCYKVEGDQKSWSEMIERIANRF